MDNYRTERLTWQGIVIEVRYDPEWLESYRDIYGYPLAPLEIESISPAKEPLPMTETGYRSWFGAPADVESDGGPVEFMRLWLDHEARSDSWKAAQAERRQLTLF
ncbi:MAG: hypothetical protein WBX16_03230 [Candidatus Acidiferrales bacterium]